MPSAMSDSLLQQVRERIEEKYRAALDGLEAIRQFVDSETLVENAQTPHKHRANGASLRERVFAVMNGQWHTVDDLAKRSGLAVGSVRGVVYAKSMNARLKKRKRRGRAEFKLTLAERGAE